MQKEIFVDNHGHSIMIIFDVLPNFLFIIGGKWNEAWLLVVNYLKKTITQEENMETRQMTPFFASSFF